MGDSKAIVAAIALLFGPGCSTLLWSVEKSLRNPGERLRAFPEKVYVQHECDKKRLPWFELEQHELVPPRIKPGGEFNHRLVYSMCPARPTQVVRGTLNTRILFKGGPIAREQVEGYELKPGRWVVDWFVSLPPGAEAGVYALQIEFKSSKVRFDETLSFAVDAR
jgi:hypothetical protein